MNPPTSDILAADKAYRRADSLTSIRSNIGPLSVIARRSGVKRVPLVLRLAAFAGYSLFLGTLVAIWCGR